jgi:hypothetical protein
VLLEQLPIQSRFRSAVSGDDKQARWGSLEFLIADLCDEVRATNHLIIQIAGGSPPTFVPHPRPFSSSEPESKTDELLAMVDSEEYKFLRQHLPGGPGSDGPSRIKLMSERTDKPGGGSDG